MTTKHKIVFLFSGQGSQYRGMGEKLYKTHPSFAKSLEQSDSIVQQHLGISLLEELYHKKDKDFDDLLITHPAIVAVELAILDVIASFGITHDYVSGNSLGEFAAGVAAGIWTKKVALETAIEQAKSFSQSRVEGGMIAVINAAKNQWMPLIKETLLHITSENFPNHFTLSGSIAALDEFQNSLKNRDIQFLRLPVRYPFHSPLIAASPADFMYYMHTSAPLQPPSNGFISGLYNKEMKEIPIDYFWKVVSQPTNFREFVHKMEEIGPCLYLDLGPSGTSATFVKYNLSMTSSSITHAIMTPYKREEQQLEALKSLLKQQH